MSIMDTLITTRVPGATYDWTDMDRVGLAMDYVAERLRGVGYDVTVTPETELTRTDFPTESRMAHYLDDLAALRSTLEAVKATTPPVPPAGPERPWLTVAEANNIEQILLDIEDSVRRLRAGVWTAAEVFCGEF